MPGVIATYAKQASTVQINNRNTTPANEFDIYSERTCVEVDKTKFLYSFLETAYD